jgi:hypothetical protein
MAQRWIIRGFFVGFLLLCVGGLAVGTLPFAGRGPSELVVHIDGPWRHVHVQSETSNVPSPLNFSPPAKEIRIKRLGYGRYDIAIEFEDNRTLWLQCFHSDTGMAKNLDVTIQRPARGDTVQVATICTYRRRSPSHDVISVVIDQTSATAPARIWGGP